MPVADCGRPCTGSIHQNVGIWFVDQTIKLYHIPCIILHPRFLFSWLIPCIHSMRLSEHSHQISMTPSQTYNVQILQINMELQKKHGRFGSDDFKTSKTGVMFRSQEVPGGHVLWVYTSFTHSFVARRVAQPHGSWYPSVHSWHAVPKRWQRYDVVGSPGSGENPPGNFATKGKRENGSCSTCFFPKILRKKMDFHWMNQWMNNGWEMFFGNPEGSQVDPALVEGREGVVAACCKNLFPFLLKATTWHCP